MGLGLLNGLRSQQNVLDREPTEPWLETEASFLSDLARFGRSNVARLLRAADEPARDVFGDEPEFLGWGIGQPNLPEPPVPNGAPRYRLATTAPEWGRLGGAGVEPPAGSLPQIDGGDARQANILAGAPGVFGFSLDPPDPALGQWQVHERGDIGRDEVRKHDRHGLIEEEAARVGIDSDLIRAVMYQENARGHYWGGSWLWEQLGWADSILPMNIQPDRWRELGIDEDSAYDARTNIRAGARLLRAIVDRLPDPTPAKVASIWNDGKRTTVSEFGARVGRTYLAKPWLDADRR